MDTDRSYATQRKTLEVVAKGSAGLRPAKANLVELGGLQLGEIEAGANRQLRKARVMLETANALFGDGEEQLAVVHQAGGGIVHLGIVDSEGQHGGSPRVRLTACSLRGRECVGRTLRAPERSAPKCNVSWFPEHGSPTGG